MNVFTACAALAFGSSLALTMAGWLRSVGMRRQGLLGWLALVLLLAAIGGMLRLDDPRIPRFAAVLLIGAGLWSTHVARVVWRAWSDRAEPGIGARLRTLGIALGATFSVYAVLAASALDERWAVPAGLVAFGAMLVMGWSAFELGSRHAARGDGPRAALARLFGVWSLSGLALPLAALTKSEIFLVAGVGLVTFPVFAPFVIRRLLGPGPVPLDLLPGEVLVPRPTFASQFGPVAFVGLLATGALLFGYGAHYGRCAGGLDPVTVGNNWREFPVVAEGDHESLGPFKFRAYHFDYKGYPSEYGDASLGDPALCFGAGISLERWFAGDMYRSPADLRLRQQPGSSVFVVSAVSGDEQLLAGFERRVAARRAFDSAENRFYLLLSSALFGLGGVGLVLAVITRARARSSKILRRVALVCLVGSLLSTLTMQQIWSSDRTPRPGRELAIEHAWMI